MSVTDNLPNDLLTPYNPNGGYDGSGINPSYLEPRVKATQEQREASLNSKPSYMLGNVKVSGIIALVVVFGLLYWAYKAYPTATKWIVGIGIGIYIAFIAYLYLFFSWGNKPTRWEKWFGTKQTAV